MVERRWGISQKFILFISLSVLAFLVAIFLISRDVLRNYALRSADELSFTILDQTDKRLRQFFEEMEYLARGLAATRVVQAVDEEGMGDLFVSTVLPRRRYLRGIYLGTAEGQMFEWGVGKGFTEHRPSFPPGYDPRERPWYHTAIEKGDFTISEPYLFASVDDLGITCVLPVRAQGGDLVGVLGLDILLDDLRRILEDLEIPKQGKALLLSSKGEIVASQFPEDRLEERWLKLFAISGGEGMLDTPSGSFVGLIDGQEMHFVYKKTSNADWIIVVAMPFGSIMESMHALLNIISLIEFVLMMMLILALAIITSRLILVPLSTMVSVINRIEGGEKGARVKVRSGDEFGVLGEEFNKLVDTVDGYSRDLEEKVRRRTEEIWLLQKENTQLRIVEERQRIYRDMHDTIGAKLTNIFFCNGVARDLAKGGPEKLREMLDKIESNCLQAVASLKGIILGMQKDDRIGSDIVKFVSAGIRQRLEAKKIVFDCRVRNRRELGCIEAELRAELEKVLEELVSNVLRHSDAVCVRLRLSVGPKGLSLKFGDDGVGFDHSGIASSAFGIDNIRYRVERLGGNLLLRTAPGAGTEYSIFIPLKRAKNEE